MNIIIGNAESDKHEFPLEVLTNWGSAVIQQLDSLQDVNKFWSENQQGFDKKPGQSGLSEVEARIPARLIHVYLQAHPDLDIQDDRQWYKFLDAHPEIDCRRRREGHVKA